MSETNVVFRLTKDAKKFVTGGVLGLLLGLAFLGTAATVSYFGAGSADQLGVSLATLIAGEDQTNNVLRVEQQYSYKIVTADTQVKASAGFVHAISCATSAGAAATAGALTLRDATTETTPIAHTIGIPASAFTPFGFVIDEVFTTGIYAGFDATLAGVSCTVSYR